MLIKKKIKPRAVCAESGMNTVRPLRCTGNGELVVHQANNLNPLNVQFDPDGAVIVRDKQKTVDVEGTVNIEGIVSVDNALTVKPVTVSNMPDRIQIQEPLHTQQISVEAQVTPFSFEGYGLLILSKPCKVYSIHLTVYEPTVIEIANITGKMQIREELRLDLFPRYIQVDKLQIKTTEYVKVGGYVLYED